jgi:glucuronoxylan 4-O-methyltransferase
LSDWKILLNQDPKNLAIELPPEILETAWDLIFVDAPEGYEATKPGRMQSIYMASILAQKGKAHVFVHDCDRPAERAYCDRFLSCGCLIRSVEKLRHYKFVK